MFFESFINNPRADKDMPEKSLEERITSPRTLVIDDEEDVRYLTVRALQKYVGAQVDQAATLEEAYTFLAQNQYDLIVSDTRLPTDKGYHLLEELNGHRSFPIVAMSSATEIRVNTNESRHYTNQPRSAYYAEHWMNRGAEAFFDKAILNDQAGRVFAAKVKEVLQAYYHPN